MATNPKSLVFEGRAPSGAVYRIFEDGSCDGFPEPMFVVNHFVRRYNLCAGLLIRCVRAGIVSEADADRMGILPGRARIETSHAGETATDMLITPAVLPGCGDDISVFEPRPLTAAERALEIVVSQQRVNP